MLTTYLLYIFCQKHDPDDDLRQIEICKISKVCKVNEIFILLSAFVTCY